MLIQIKLSLAQLEIASEERKLLMLFFISLVFFLLFHFKPIQNFNECLKKINVFVD